MEGIPHYTSSGKCKLRDSTIYLLEWPKFRTLTAPMLVRMWNNRNSPTLLGIQNDKPLWEADGGFLFVCFIKITIQSSSHASLSLPKRAENLGLHENLQKDVYRSFTHNCQNLEATKMSFSR